MQTNTITIVGLGRTGTSIALALKEGSADFSLIGHDSDSGVLREKPVVEAFDHLEADLIKACAPADIIVLAMPAVALEVTLSLIGDRLQSHALVIDLTALKEPGIRFADQHLHEGHYIGARPVFAAATFESLKADLYEARADLFRNSVFCVMPSAETDPQAVDTAVKFGQLLGAKPYFVDPLEYDQLSLGTETMPAIGAAALLQVITKSTGWRDILRFADLPFAIGTLPLDTDSEDLAYHLLNDRQASLYWLDGLAVKLTELRRVLAQGEQELLAAYLAELNLARDKWLQARSDNEWDEAQMEDLNLPSVSEHFLGGLIGGRNRDS
jgi:prephenate dehydrogenase